MGLCTYYRGRLNFFDLYDSDVRIVRCLYKTMLIEVKSKDNQQVKAAEIMEDELMGG